MARAGAIVSLIDTCTDVHIKAVHSCAAPEEENVIGYLRYLS